jgi:SAM-dependent MidA family methyltransferase
VAVFTERGSLHCHFRHKLNDNPFVNVGEQDITTHVDFTTLSLGGIEAGLAVTGFTTQKNFLLGLGVLDELKTPASLGADGVEEVNFNRAVGQLISGRHGHIQVTRQSQGRREAQARFRSGHDKELACRELSRNIVIIFPMC